jgi:hypothetical protein
VLMNFFSGKTRVKSDIAKRCVDAMRCSEPSPRSNSATPLRNATRARIVGAAKFDLTGTGATTELSGADRTRRSTVSAVHEVRLSHDGEPVVVSSPTCGEPP